MLEALYAQPAAQAGASRHRSDPAVTAAAAASRGARRARVPFRDDRHLRRAAGSAHQLHPARRSTTAKFAYLPFRVEDFYQAGRAQVPRLLGLAAQHRGDPGARRGSHPLERHADRSRGCAQRRARGREQPGGPACPGRRRADPALVRHVAAARRGLGRPDLSRRPRRGPGIALRMGRHRARDAADAARGWRGVGGAPRPAGGRRQDRAAAPRAQGAVRSAGGESRGRHGGVSPPPRHSRRRRPTPAAALRRRRGPTSACCRTCSALRAGHHAVRRLRVRAARHVRARRPEHRSTRTC